MQKTLGYGNTVQTNKRLDDIRKLETLLHLRISQCDHESNFNSKYSRDTLKFPEIGPRHLRQS